MVPQKDKAIRVFKKEGILSPLILPEKNEADQLQPSGSPQLQSQSKQATNSNSLGASLSRKTSLASIFKDPTRGDRKFEIDVMKEYYFKKGAKTQEYATTSESPLVVKNRKLAKSSSDKGLTEDTSAEKETNKSIPKKNKLDPLIEASLVNARQIKVKALTGSLLEKMSEKDSFLGKDDKRRGSLNQSNSQTRFCIQKERKSTFIDKPIFANQAKKATL